MSPPQSRNTAIAIAVLLVVVALAAYIVFFSPLSQVIYERAAQAQISTSKPVLNVKDYNDRLLALAHINVASTTLNLSSDYLALLASSTASTTPHYFVATTTASTSVKVAGKLWPHPATYPQTGALLPFNRIVAYYGNFYSKQMGVLGEYPQDQMLAMLASTTASWAKADPSTPTIPAVDYIAVTAQASAGADGKYRARMPGDQIEKAIGLAAQVHGVVVLDVQVGLSSVPNEVALLAPYLKYPQVELALDPEFDMQASGVRPGNLIGTMDANEINWAAQYLAQIVQQNNLPPKFLVVHRFTQEMVTNVSKIKPLPEVEVVMDMDGFGSRAKKIGTYTNIVAPEPVQFTGFKLFYKNDIPPRGDVMLTPAQILSLTPAPVFIQYQ